MRAAAIAIDEVYKFSCAGGGLHIVVDDWNIETSYIEWCVAHSIDNEKLERNDSGAGIEADKRCAQLLLDLSLEERASALALQEGFWGYE